MHGNTPRSPEPGRRKPGWRPFSSLTTRQRVIAVTATTCALALLGGGIATAFTLAL